MLKYYVEMSFTFDIWRDDIPHVTSSKIQLQS